METISLKKYKAKNGHNFAFEIVRDGEAYGYTGNLVHKGEPLITFYDADTGQMVSRYYFRSVYTPAHRTGRCGLRLEGSVPAWTIDGRTLATMLGDAYREVHGVSAVGMLI